ncbi:MAG: hypothetical protein C4527_18350 [Candidatus Omnitrophota bacterium]|jgi:Ca2+/Na+ antiporter|nr:MAG: hypothetical protein C4527_18350 [Candidatus Omnitrophota bacterium]
MISNPKQRRRKQLESQIERFSKIIGQLETRSNRYSWARLFVFTSGVIGVYAMFKLAPDLWGWITLMASAFLFSFLVCIHCRIERGIKRHTIWRQIKRTHIARMQLDWENISPTYFHSPGEPHPHEIDLNLTGKRSLHRLLDTTISQEGRRQLYRWLINTKPDLDSLRLRQGLVRELAPLSNFRDRFRLIAKLSAQTPDQEGWEGERLLLWLERHTHHTFSKPFLISLSFLAVTNVVLLILTLSWQIQPFWMITFLVYIALYLITIRQAAHLFGEASHIEERLRTFKSLMRHLEVFPYEQNSQLSLFCEPFWNNETRPSHFLSRIEWIVGAAGCSQKNPVLGLILNVIGPWDYYFAYQLDRYKRKIKHQLRVWLERLYELDALCSLANFSYLHPDYVFPTLHSSENQNRGSVFASQNLGHPLLPDEKRVCNDFSVETLGEIAIVTGSNMSGKSTFLRTLGVNQCLALAGGPVTASFFETILFRLFTCINVSDSLSDGLSSFYAEVRRLKELLTELEKEDPRPLFFLIDEIFRGTNNKERQIGSNAYVRALSQGRGVGMISTHDLELVHLADELDGIRNYHFREDVHDGRMAFDYRLRGGPCPTTNALKIMRMEGLPVELLHS